MCMKWMIKQKGWNPSFPEKAVVWKYTPEGALPDWISDNLYIAEITPEGSYILRTAKYSTGRLGFLDSQGAEIFSIPSETDGWVIWDSKKFYGLTRKQLNYLYEKI